MGQISELFNRHREKILLFVYFIIVTVFAGGVANMIGQAWKSAWVLQSLINAAYVFYGVSIHQIGSVSFGFFLGSLILMTIDPKKRWQGLLLWVAIIIALIAFGSIGLFDLNFVGNIAWLIAGIAVGIAVNGGQRLVDRQLSEPLEFRRAASSVFFLIVIIVLFGLIEFHLTYPQFITVQNDFIEINPQKFSVKFTQQSLFSNLVFSAVFLITLRRFIQYDAEREFFLLGPPASGKSMFLLGMYLEARERIDERDFTHPLRPSPDLLDMIDQMSSQASGWVIDATDPGEIGELSFQYIHGTVFPQNIEVITLDYAGEHLEQLPDALHVPEDFDEDPIISSLVERIRSADQLILMIDTARFVNDEDLNISSYPSLIQASDADDILLVATKADLLAEEFYEDTRRQAHRNFMEFSEYVHDRLAQDDLVYTVLQEAGGAEIHPVYYQTKETDDGERVPQRDESNSLMTVGYGELLDKIGG